ncbi:MAG: hypothetical protein AAF657_39975, partial [Acidobacteriota bacterium]
LGQLLTAVLERVTATPDIRLSELIADLEERTRRHEQAAKSQMKSASLKLLKTKRRKLAKV